MDVFRSKYPRTRHLASSRSVTDDDKVATAAEVEAALTGKRVIVTEKMDGENTTIYADGHSHARSIDSKFHPSRSVVKELAGLIAHELPSTYRICGENLYATHSIEYSGLPAHFQIFGIWDEDRCLAWDDTVEWAQLLNVPTVPVIYDGVWVSEDHAYQVWQAFKAALPAGQDSEGFVVRLADELTLDSFKYRAFKYVRPNHVTSSDHWMHQEIKVNGLVK